MHHYNHMETYPTGYRKKNKLDKNGKESQTNLYSVYRYKIYK